MSDQPDVTPEAVTAAIASLSKHADMHMWLTAAEGTVGGLLMRKELLTRAVIAAAPAIRAGEWAKLQPAIDRVARLAEAAQEKAVAVAVAAERERIRQLAIDHGATYEHLGEYTGGPHSIRLFADLLEPAP